MIVEERYGNQVNAEEFSVEVKRGYIYCNEELSNLLYLIGRSVYVNKDGKEIHKSEVLRREPFSKAMLETMLDQKDSLKRKQEEINILSKRMAPEGADYAAVRKIRIENGWALKEQDE